MSFLPTSPLKNLVRRAELIRRIRTFFDGHGFIEVETPVLSQDIVVDRHLEPFTVDIRNTAYYLQTSPEFALKRLLAAGMTAIYQIGPVFRRGDRGTVHNHEFTMLEWYRVGEDYLAGMRFLSELIDAVLNREPAESVTLRSLFLQHAGMNPHTCGVTEFQNFAKETDMVFPGSYRTGEAYREDWTDLIFSERIQPKLGFLQPLIVYDYPDTQPQLARTVFLPEEKITVSQRFELFIDGMELANGYHELLDPSELKQRFERINTLRKLDGKKSLPVESRLLAAMRHGLPPCSGTALGLDRLVMVALGAKSIDEVIPFPLENA
ncbi:MAG: EF-P lysine aminoacylase GenX [Planctomycetaceae bacterium]|jgi:lysyl-tRNA synthetase class 2|nr:EF-P lysine aminoacylase GenX [Planctomycetaceae bacterium]